MKRPEIKKYIQLSVKDSVITAAVFAAAIAVCFVLQNFSEDDTHVPLIFVLVVVIISILTSGYFYGMLSSVLGVIAVNYVFTYPYFELNFALTGYPLTFLTMLFVSFVTCTLTTRIKNQEKYILETEKEKIRADLLRGISHDIRTPLTSIIGATNAILDNRDLREAERTKLLEDVKDDSQWLIRMVENILSVTRIGNEQDTIKKEPEIAEEVIADAVAKFKKQQPGIEVNVKVPDEIVFIPMDAMLIEQVMLNFMHNSAAHGKNCSMIDVSLKSEGDSALFVFHDNGIGFDEALLSENKIRSSDTSFASRSDGRRNMGIGLSVCAAIIRAHNGTMKLCNSPQGGAVAAFRLPIKES